MTKAARLHYFLESVFTIILIGCAAQGRAWREERDWLLVKGADKPMSVYQPIAEHDSATDVQKEVLGRFTRALDLYRARRFAEACSTLGSFDHRL